MRSLRNILLSHSDTDKATIHSYDEVYEALFEPIRLTCKRVLEIGVRRGGSMRAWREYFPKADIYGIDNGSEAGLPEFADDEDRLHFFQADTTRPREMIADKWVHAHLFDAHNRCQFDIVIDDGLHHPYAQALNFGLFSPLLRPGGLFVVEDCEDVSFAQTFKRLFGGEVYDRREKKVRHDDILFVWRAPE